MKATRVFHDENGETHFEIITIKGEESASGIFSEKLYPTSMVFRDSGDAIDVEWHNAPQSLYIFMMEGKVKVEVSDGDERIFEAGDVLLMEDTEGKGHKASSPDGKGRSALMVFMDETISK